MKSIALALGLANCALAQWSSNEVPLRGITGFAIESQCQGTGTFPCDSAKTMAEARLRVAGIRVSGGLPLLIISIDSMPIETGNRISGYSTLTRMTVVDIVSRTANPAENFPIGVWAASKTSISSSPKAAVRGNIEEMLDQLINCVLKANPR